MGHRRRITRRGFVGGTTALLAYAGLSPISARASSANWRRPDQLVSSPLWQEADDYDSLVKLNYNENPYGPSDAVLKAMTKAFKYSMRYGYPDGGVRSVIAEHHGVGDRNVLLGAGSSEILEVVGLSLLGRGKKIVGVDTTFEAVYVHASGINAEAITVPLGDNYRQDIPALIEATNKHHDEVGFVYLCNPNNPTGTTVSAAEVRQLLDGIPNDVPVLIDEAYHHFVEDPDYATSIPYVLEGRPVIIARTFSKLFGMAAMRLGFAITTPEMIARMTPYLTGSINALAKWGAVAALEDVQAQQRVRDVTVSLRKKAVRELAEMGYESIPSETNFFMLHTGRPARRVGAAFRQRGIAVGRLFPPLPNHLRVSIGTEDEMAAFMTAFKEIFAA